MYNFKINTIIIFLFSIFSVISIANLEISNVPETYIPQDLDSFKALKKSEEIFANDETLIFVFKLSSVLNKDELERLKQFTTNLKQHKQIKDVHSIFNYESIKGTEDGFEIQNIIDEHKLDDLNNQSILINLKKDRFVKDLFATRNGKVFSIVIEPKFLKDSLSRFQLEEDIFKLKKELNLDKIQKAYGGDFVIDMAQFRESVSLVTKVIPIVSIVGFLIIFLIYGNLTSVILTAGVNGLTTMFSIGLLSVLNYEYNLLTSIIPTLMLALSTTFCVHLFNGINHHYSTSLKEAVLPAKSQIQKPSLFSAITTALGLFSLSFSSIPPLGAVGIVSGVGVIIIFYLVVHYIPMLLTSTNIFNWKTHKKIDHYINNALVLLSSFTINHYKKILIAVVIILASSLNQIVNVKSESNLYKFFSQDHSVNQSVNYIKNKFVGITTISILIEDKSEQNILLAPTFMTKIDKLQQELKAHPSIDRVFSSVDIIKQIHWAFHNEQKEMFSIPATKELIEQYLFIYDGSDLFDFLDRDYKYMKIVININKESANEIEKIEEYISKSVNTYNLDKNLKVDYSGYGKIFSDQENLVVNDLFSSLYASSILILLTMIILWKSIKDSLFCMIPNFSPILGMFIIMGFSGIWLDFGTAMIASITLGIAVDDTIHMYWGIKKRLKSMDIYSAINETFLDSGKAIIFTTIILSAQFFLLSLSEFKPLKYFGMLTSIGLFMALIFDLFILPATLILLSKFQSKYSN